MDTDHTGTNPRGKKWFFYGVFTPPFVGRPSIVHFVRFCFFASSTNGYCRSLLHFSLLCRLRSFLGQSSCNAWTSSIRDFALPASDRITSIPFVAHRQDTQPLPVIRVALSFLSSRAVHTIDQGNFLRLDQISLQLSLSSSNLGRPYRHFQPLNEF